MKEYVHISQLDTDTPGAPWCEASGTVVVTDDPIEVTCPECLDHLRTCSVHATDFRRRLVDFFTRRRAS